MFKMEVTSVLVESQLRKGDYVFGNSGILLNNEFVITSANIIAPFFRFFEQEENSNSNLQSLNHLELKNISFNVIASIHEKSNIIRKAHVIGYFHSKNINQSSKLIFQNWAIDSQNQNNFRILGFFIIFQLDGTNTSLLNSNFNIWFNKMPKHRLLKGQNVKCVSTAFGNRNFMNHHSAGIISNILGNDDCLLFSDLSLTPGSEGSPVFCDQLSEVPIGIVISVINWWKNEWLNFTVIADLRPLFIEFFKFIKFPLEAPLQYSNFRLLSTIETSLFQAYNGTVWGTAILIDQKKGILISNAHVTESSLDSIILYKDNNAIPCKVVYSTPRNHFLDIAIIQTEHNLGVNCKSVIFSKKTLRCGEIVYAAGFPIFPKESNAGATMTKGCISYVQPQMIKTTCAVHPGASGGAILDEDGDLIAMIVCNAKTCEHVDMVYPRVNMSIPISLVEPILCNYIKNEDIRILEDLSLINANAWTFSNKL